MQGIGASIKSISPVSCELTIQIRFTTRDREILSRISEELAEQGIELRETGYHRIFGIYRNGLEDGCPPGGIYTVRIHTNQPK